MGLIEKTKKRVNNLLGLKSSEQINVASSAMAAEKLQGYVSPDYKVSKSVKIDLAIAIFNRCLLVDRESPEFEAYRMLRTKILSETEGKGSVAIMVTSPLSGEGKTTTAINLALTFAREFNQTALLVDCDLCKQDVCKTLGFKSEKNLVDYLALNTPLSDIIVWPGIEKLTIISGEKTICGSGDILASPLMKQLIEDLKSRYSDRFIIFDLPPVIGSSDAVVFSAIADYILIVAETGKTTENDLKKTVEMLPKEKILGVVMNNK